MVQLTDRANTAGFFAPSVSSRTLFVRLLILRDDLCRYATDESPLGHNMDTYWAFFRLLARATLCSLDCDKTPLLGRLSRDLRLCHNPRDLYHHHNILSSYHRAHAHRREPEAISAQRQGHNHAIYTSVYDHTNALLWRPLVHQTGILVVL